MANIKEILKGAGFFVLSYIVMIIVNYTVPPLLEAMEGIYSSADLQGIIWFGIILLYILMGLVLPNVFIYRGLQEPSQGGDKLIEALVGVLIFIFSMLLTVKGWYVITTFASLTTNFFIIAIFWVGTVIIWTEITLIVPGYLLMQALKTD